MECIKSFVIVVTNLTLFPSKRKSHINDPTSSTEPKLKNVNLGQPEGTDLWGVPKILRRLYKIHWFPR